MDRRSSLPSGRPGNGSTSLSLSTHHQVSSHSHGQGHSRHGHGHGHAHGPGVLRQFRPAISDQWLTGQMSRRMSMSTSSTDTSHASGSGSGGSLLSSRSGSDTGGIMRMSSSSVRPSVPSTLVCPECLQIFDSPHSLEMHLLRKHSDSSSSTSTSHPSTHPLLNCPHCAEHIKHRTNLHRHIRVKHDERTGKYHCRKCPVVCDSEHELETHKQKHRVCPFCRVIMESGTGLAKHMQNCRQRIHLRR